VTQPPYGPGEHPGPPPGYGPPPSYGPPPGYGYPPGYGPPPPAPKPGCVPLRPLGLGDILDGSFTMIRRNPRVMLGLSAAVAVAQVLLVALFELIAFSQLGDVKITDAGDSTRTTDLGPLLGTEGASFATLVASTLLGAVLTGMLTVAITQDVLGVRLGPAEVWARTKGRIWRLLALAVVATVAEFVGLLFCLAPGIWLWGIWAVAVPAMMTEHTTMRGAFGRSRALVAGTFWRVWGIRALGVAIASVIGGFIALPFEIVGLVVDSNTFSDTADSSIPVVFLVLTAVGSAVSATFTAPIRAGVDALLYVDLRMRKEGLDIVLQQSIGRPRGDAPPTVRTAF
jgi:hypothetical protein